MIVSNPEDYYFNSTRNYAGMESHFPIVMETNKLSRY
jgi:hypothetical protein